MEITKEFMMRVAANARIALTAEELEEFIPDFKEILDTFEKLKEVNTEKVKSSFQPVSVRNVVREDVPRICVSQEKILSNTKHKKEQYFLGPKVL